MSKEVAMVGFSKRSNREAWQLEGNVAIWTLNHGHMHGYPRIDRLYDMHPWELINDPHFYTREYQQGHLDFLKSEHEYPIYMIEQYPEIPASVRYPIEAAKALAGKYLYFTSTFCYMAAAAIMEGYDKWYILGFDMDTGTEYEYQREEAFKWIGFAHGRGVDIYIPETSGLYVPRRLYGYEGIPMISRQLLEIHVKQHKREMEKSLEQMHRWQGILEERRRHATARRLIDEAAQQVLGYDRQAAMNEGAVRVLEFLIETSDLKEVYPGMNDPALKPAEDAE